jgi:hypothetical protein
LARFVIPNGVVIQPGANSMTVEHNRITGGGEGVDACPTEKTWCSEMRIIGNQFVGPFGEDAIHANRYHGLYVEGNEITGVRENGACRRSGAAITSSSARTTCTTTAARASSSRTRR